MLRKLSIWPYAKAASTPLALLILVCGSLAANRAGFLPSTAELLTTVGALIGAGGIVAVIGVSALENVVGLNAYFPGSVVILTAMASTTGHPALAIATWFGITAGAVTGQGVSYVIGRTFRSASEPVEEPMRPAFALSFWHPQVAALVSLRAGQANMSVPRYLARMAPALVGWNAFWGIMMYGVGASFFTSSDGELFLVAVLILWSAWEMWRFHARARSIPTPDAPC